MIQLVAEIHPANADAPDIFDYIIEAFEIVLIRLIYSIISVKINIVEFYAL